MKHHITLKQWDEITKEQKNILWDSGFKRDWKMNIIQMMEFLGDDVECMSRDKIGDDWLIEIRYYRFSERTEWERKELCDALWEVVKYKLR